MTAGAQHPPQFSQRGDAVVEVMDNECENDGVDRPVVNPVQRLREVMDSEGRAVAETCARKFDHPDALIEADHLRPAGQKLLGVEARATAGIENQPPIDVSEQREHRGPVVQRVVRTDRGMRLEVGRPPLIDRTHRTIITDPDRTASL